MVAQRTPQPRGGDEQLEPDLALELGVAGDQHVSADGVGDVRVDVERGRPGRPVAGALLAADRPPGERGAAQAQLLGPLVGQRQDRLAPAQGVRRGVGLEVAEHRQAERLGVPERVAVVARAGQALGPDRPALGPRTGLQHVEDRDADGLLQLGVALDLDVRVGPELVEERALLAAQPLPPGVAGGRETGPDLVVHGRQRPPRRPAVGQVLDHAQHGAGLQPADDGGAADVLAGLGGDLGALGAADLVVHRRGHAQPGVAGVVDEGRAGVVAAVLFGDQRVEQRGLDAGVPAGGRGQLLVGHQLGLDDDQRLVLDLDLVADRRDGALGQRDQPLAAHLDGLARRAAPADLAGQRARLQVQHALVAVHLAVAQVERLVVHQQPDDLAVGDVDDRLARLRVAVPALGVRQRPPLVEGVEVGARRGVRLPLVEVAAQADVAVGQREDGLGDAEGLHVERRLAHDPRLDGERASRIGTHRFPSGVCLQQIGEVGDDDVRTVLAQRVGLPEPVHADDEAEPARLPCRDAGEGVLEHDGLLLRHVEVRRGGEERVGRGLARQVPLLRDHPVDPVVDQVGEPGDLQHHLGVRRRRHHGGHQARVPHGVQVAHRPGVDVDAVGADLLVDELVLAGRQADDRLGVRPVGRLALRQRDPPGGQEGARAVQPRLAVDVRAVVGLDVERFERGSRRARACARRKSSNICFHAAACTLAVSVSTPSRSNRQARVTSGRPSMRATYRLPVSGASRPVDHRSGAHRGARPAARPVHMRGLRARRAAPCTRRAPGTRGSARPTQAARAHQVHGQCRRLGTPRAAPGAHRRRPCMSQAARAHLRRVLGARADGPGRRPSGCRPHTCARAAPSARVVHSCRAGTTARRARAAHARGMGQRLHRAGRAQAAGYTADEVQQMAAVRGAHGRAPRRLHRGRAAGRRRRAARVARAGGGGRARRVGGRQPRVRGGDARPVRLGPAPGRRPGHPEPPPVGGATGQRRPCAQCAAVRATRSSSSTGWRALPGRGPSSTWRGTAPFEQAVISADAALRAGLERPALDDGAAPGPGMAGRARRPPGGRLRRGAQRERRGVAQPGRHRPRGLPAPALQLPVRYGGSTAYTPTSAWAAERTVGEFDGKAKYDRLLRPGQQAGEVGLRREGARGRDPREDWEVVRWTWHDLRDFGPTAARIRERFRAG